jgi:hypothetical protein
MKKFTLPVVVCLVFISAFLKMNAQPVFTSNILFVAKLTGDQEVPPVTTSAIGEASFAMNSTHDTMCINVTVKGLSGPIMQAHIHEGPIGGSGPPVIDLSNNINGQRITMMLTAIELTPAVVAKFFGGNYYINVHTSANPNGEIRGQILLETDYAFKADMNGANEVPAVSTNATGLATFDLSRNNISLTIHAIFKDLSSPVTGAHLHTGAPGISGPVVQSLDSGISGNTITITVDPTAYLTDFIYGNVYINIHTQNNPNGEIRGQVVKIEGISFDAVLEGANEVPPVATPATGIGYTYFSPAADTLYYDFMADGFTSTFSGAHFHSGATGATGGVLIDLSSNFNNGRLTGMVTGTDLPSTFMNECLTGNVYVNMHTSNNPNGEIRSQMKRFLREGFTYSFDGNQEVPPTPSLATGTGIASIDRDIDNLHFRMVVTGLTGPATSAHFHNAVAGVSGNIIFDLSPYITMAGSDDAAFNYWLSSDGFDVSMANLFFQNAVYANFHTAQFTGGEVRAQVLQGGSCFAMTTEISSVSNFVSDVTIYPNPVYDANVNIEFQSEISGSCIIQLTDISGRIISDTEANILNGENKFSVSVHEIPAGIYFVNLLQKDKKFFSSRIVKF